MKVGLDLSTQVAQKLKWQASLMYTHRDYCGTGLTHVNGIFIYGHVYDGNMQDSIREFRTNESFIAWLAEQSDESLRGVGEDAWHLDNQRVTISRLRGFVL